MHVTYENINNHDISVHIHTIRRNMSTFVTSRIDSLRERLLQKNLSKCLLKHAHFSLTNVSAQQRKIQPSFISSNILRYLEET
jgi:hypothetical protein